MCCVALCCVVLYYVMLCCVVLCFVAILEFTACCKKHCRHILLLIYAQSYEAQQNFFYVLGSEQGNLKANKRMSNLCMLLRLYKASRAELANKRAQGRLASKSAGERENVEKNGHEIKGVS